MLINCNSDVKSKETCLIKIIAKVTEYAELLKRKSHLSNYVNILEVISIDLLRPRQNERREKQNDDFLFLRLLIICEEELW